MLMVREDYVNATEGHIFNSSSWQTSFADTPSELYRIVRAEFGRCISKAYIDQDDGGALAIGWVFVKRVKYDDCSETFLQETWIHYRTACEGDC